MATSLEGISKMADAIEMISKMADAIETISKMADAIEGISNMADPNNFQDSHTTGKISLVAASPIRPVCLPRLLLEILVRWMTHYRCEAPHAGKVGSESMENTVNSSYYKAVWVREKYQ